MVSCSSFTPTLGFWKIQELDMVENGDMSMLLSNGPQSFRASLPGADTEYSECYPSPLIIWADPEEAMEELRKSRLNYYRVKKKVTFEELSIGDQVVYLDILTLTLSIKTIRGITFEPFSYRILMTFTDDTIVLLPKDLMRYGDSFRYIWSTIDSGISGVWEYLEEWSDRIDPESSFRVTQQLLELEDE